MSKSVLEKVTDIVVEELAVDRKDVKPESSFIENLNADSLDTVELVMRLEEVFNLEIPESEVEKIKTVQAAVDFITAKTEGVGSAN